jgi:excisionase family DNA binding protein
MVAEKTQPRSKNRADFPDVLTPQQAAAYLQVSVGMVLDKARAGVLPGVKLGREWRFSRRQLLRWVEDEGLPEDLVEAGLVDLVEERRAATREEDFVPWDEVKRELGL